METLSIIFWAQIAALVIHIFEESTLGGGFVEKVKEHWWPDYSWVKFFWFNTVFMFCTILANLFFDLFGGHFLILPLAFIIHFVFNSGFHIWWSIRYKEYSPGLLTSVNYWLLLYFVIKFGIATPGRIENEDLTAAIALGTALGLFTSFGTYIAGRIAANKREGD